MAKPRDWLQLMRLPALFTAWSNILAAQLIVSGGALDWRALLLLIGASSGLYLAGMVLNDCFDIEVDRAERPNRPLPSGRIARRPAWLLGWGLLLAGCGLAALAGPRSLAIALPLALLIGAYDGWLKRYPVGALAMGGCRYLNWLLGLSVAPLTPLSWLLPLPILLYVGALTVLGSIEVHAERRAPVGIALAGLAASAIALLLLTLGPLPQRWALLPAAALFGLLGWRLMALFEQLTPQRIQQMMKLLLLGIIPLDALLVAAGGPWWGALPVLLLLLPGRLLAGRIYIT